MPADGDAPPEHEFPEAVESPAQVLGRVIGLEGLVCRAQAEQAEALVTFAGHCPVTGPHDRGFAGRADVSEFVVDELSCALSLTRRAVDMRLSLALRLTECLPGTFAAWKAGDLDLRRVRVIADRTMVLSPEQATTVESRILPKAGGKTTAQLQRLVDKAVIAVDPDAANARHEQARHDRHVQLRPSQDGMSTLRAELSAEDALTLYATLSLIARTFPASDPRTMNQRRADSLIDLVTGRTTTPPTVPAGPDVAATGRSGRETGPAGGAPADTPDNTRTKPDPGQPEPDRTTPHPTVPAGPDVAATGPSGRKSGPAGGAPADASATTPDPPSGCGCTCGAVVSNYTGPHRANPPGTNTAGGTARPGKPLVHVIVTAETLLGLDDAPAELAGHGPIPSDLARRIAAQGTWHRILTDPLTGQALNYGRTTYRPPATLADHVKARDRVCRFPPCQT
ncbi:MAG TPA: DUF222 domain-containing protein, partial [Mycobacteriales bacterium]|nr:DUF222 domain-containing protein [Mycobacteriales bacterium]